MFYILKKNKNKNDVESEDLDMDIEIRQNGLRIISSVSSILSIIYYYYYLLFSYLFLYYPFWGRVGERKLLEEKRKIVYQHILYIFLELKINNIIFELLNCFFFFYKSK